MIRYLILGVMLTMLGGAQSQAQGNGVPVPPDEIVAIRQSMMDLQQGVLAAMKAGVEQKTDVKPFLPGAKGLVASSKVITAMFPPGTEKAGTEKAGDTKALPAIWSDKADFAAKAKSLEDAAGKLVKLADANDKAGFATQFKEVGQACGACHKQYKQKE